MTIDSHVHIGIFEESNFCPSLVSSLMERVGVSYYAVSSTTMCTEDYEKVLYELHEVIKLDGTKVLPVMWITPEGLNGNIAWFLESDIEWKCLKIHPYLHPKEWNVYGERFAEVIDIARELKVPLLIHTGDETCCQCGQYEPLIASNPDVIFILAHGRPLVQIIPLLKKYPNAYTDSAFMPINDMGKLMDEGLSHKLLWGTDMCIPKHFFPKKDMVKYYQYKLNEFKKISNSSLFEQVIFKNAIKVFKIKID